MFIPYLKSKDVQNDLLQLQNNVHTGEEDFETRYPILANYVKSKNTLCSVVCTMLN